MRPALLALGVLSACAWPRDGQDRAPAADPRPVAPISGMLVFARRPVVRWRGTETRVRVQFCADRACASVLADAWAETSSVAPGVDLPDGVVYWRVFDPAAGDPADHWTPAWWFIVAHGARAGGGTGTRLSLAAQFDVDGDGRWDAVDAAGVVHPGNGRQSRETFALHRPGTRSAVNVGDLNGDGYLDLAVGDATARNGAGEVDVYLGPLAGPEAPVSQVLQPPAETRDGCGSRVASGDFDGDGYSDLLLSCPGALQGRGRTYVYRGSSTGLDAVDPAVLDSPGRQGANFAAYWAADLNDDGLDDAVVGAPDFLPGYAAVHTGSPEGLSRSPAWSVLGDLVWRYRIGAGGLALDVDGDGGNELVIASTGGPGGCVALYGVTGGAIEPAERSHVCVAGNPESYLGASMAAGDFDGDGRGDVVATLFAGSVEEMRVSVYPGVQWHEGEGWPRSDVALPGLAPGAAVRAADVDGDGITDAVVDVRTMDGHPEQWVFRGTTRGLASVADVYGR